MKRVGIIGILQEQLKVANETNHQLLLRIDDLQNQLAERDAKLNELQASLQSIESALTNRTSELTKQQRIIKGISKIVENKSEKITPDAPKEKQDRKKRGNNNAKRNMHLEMNVEERDIYPDDPSFDISKAYPMNTHDCIRYVYIPAQFKKIVYHIHSYSYNGRFYRGTMPLAPLQNSSFDGSFIAGLMELRYIYSMPVERIAKYFTDHGFDVDRATLNGLLQKSAGLLENMYKALRLDILEDKYLGLDETYMKVLQSEQTESGKHVKKGYIWDMIGKTIKLVYYFYENGSRSEKVIMSQLKDYQGTIQSDGYIPYRKLGGEGFPKITRLACLQHIKRKFKDAEGEKDADLIIRLINELYQNEHQHRIGEDGWTAAKNERWRRKYAPPILKRIKIELNRIKNRPDIDPQGYLYEATQYMLNEMRDVENIFRSGNYDLDNNEIERYNRYISLSRRNSLFFGSHDGAMHGAVLYSLACSCRMQGVNFFEYISDVLNQKLTIPDGAGPEAYRRLLPDQWKILHTL